MKKTIKVNHIIITGLAIMIAVAGYINYTGNLRDIMNIGSVNTASDEIISNDVDPDEESIVEPGTAILTSSNNTTSTSVISEAKLNREQIRAKNKETLLGIVDNASLDEAAKLDAINQIASITQNSEQEMAAELLLEAKGFNDVVVSIINDSVDVVINKSELTDTERAQIEDIVKRKTNMTADKITQF